MSLVARAGLAALLLLALAAPVQGQERDLRQHDGSPIPGLTRQALDSVAPDRLECRKLVDVIDQLAELLSAATRGQRTEEFQEFHVKAPREFSFVNGGCMQRIAAVDDDWPRAVLQAEYELVGRLWAALMLAATTFVKGAPVDEVNSRVEAYDTVLAEWVSWLQLSSGFWAGRYLDDRPHGCLVHAQDGVDGLRARLQELGRVPPDRRTQDELEDIARDIDSQRADLALCDDATELGALEIRSLDRILTAFGAALPGLRSGDDDEVHRALGREQDHVSRMVRCRQEHALGEVSPDCRR